MVCSAGCTLTLRWRVTVSWGKREREDNTQKFKQTQKEIATWMLNKMGNQSQPRMANNNVIKVKGGEFYV